MTYSCRHCERNAMKYGNLIIDYFVVPPRNDVQVCHPDDRKDLSQILIIYNKQKGQLYKSCPFFRSICKINN